MGRILAKYKIKNLYVVLANILILISGFGGIESSKKLIIDIAILTEAKKNGQK